MEADVTIQRVNPFGFETPKRLLLQKIEQQGSLIILIAREEGTRERVTVHVPFRPYFYVPVEEEVVAVNKGLDTQPGHKGIRGEDLVRVYVDDPSGVSKRRKGFSKTWEADIPYQRRFLIDTGIKAGFLLTAGEEIAPGVYQATTSDLRPIDDVLVPSRKILYDIETNKYEDRYSVPTVAKAEVTAITLHDTYVPDKVVTLIWHPTLGTKGRVRTELRWRYSEALQRDVEWEVKWFGDEISMLLAWVQYLKDTQPDILAAWNGHYGFVKKNMGGFDAPYLITRLNNVGIGGNQMSPLGASSCGWQKKQGDKEGDNGLWYCRIDGVQLVDMMSTYAVKDGGFLGQVPYSGLKPVVKKKCGIALKKDPGEIENWWMYETEEFLVYAFKDVDAILALENKEDYCGFAHNLQRFCGVEDPNIIFRPSTLVGTLELRKAKERNVVLPSSRNDIDDEEEVEGGYVIKPKVWGRLPNVLVHDLNKMYVAIMQSANISYETCLGYVPEAIAAGWDPKDLILVPTDDEDMTRMVAFRKDFRGLTPAVLDDLVKLREVYDAKIKAATTPEEKLRWKEARTPAKSLALTAYGHMLNQFNRLFSVQTGSAVTGLGRYTIKFIESRCGDFGIQIARGDTDSVFTVLPDGEDGIEFGKWFQDDINIAFNDMLSPLGITEHNFVIEFQTWYAPFLSGPQMKQYAGRIKWQEGVFGKDTDEPHIAGLAGIKSDAAPITAEATEAVISMLINGARDVDVLSYVRTMYEAVANGEVPLADVVRSISFNFDIEKSTSTTTTLMAARNGRTRYGFEYPVGSRVTVVRAQGFESKWIGIPEGEDIPKDLAIDWEYHAGAVILGPLRGILKWIDLEEATQSIQRGSQLTVQNTL